MNKYLFDPHTHTSETSRCGKLPAVEVVDRYVKMGFSGIAVTDHLHPEYLSRIDREHNWDAAMDCYLSGYYASKKHGDELGFDVILGAELRFPENDNDYLIYGIDEEWLRKNPYICCMSALEFYAKYHDEVLIIHAHPYRDGNTTVFENAVHGTEIINANPRHENENGKALKLAEKHPGWYRLAGSDTHQAGDEGRAGILLPKRVMDSYELKEMIENRRYELWSPMFQDPADEGSEET